MLPKRPVVGWEVVVVPKDKVGLEDCAVPPKRVPAWDCWLVGLEPLYPALVFILFIRISKLYAV